MYLKMFKIVDLDGNTMYYFETEFQARINDMKRTLKPLIAYKKVLEKVIDKNE